MLLLEDDDRGPGADRERAGNLFLNVVTFSATTSSVEKVMCVVLGPDVGLFNGVFRDVFVLSTVRFEFLKVSEKMHYFKGNKEYSNNSVIRKFCL